MNLYHLARKTGGGYDTYSDFVVAAPTAERAFSWHPKGEPRLSEPDPVEMARDSWRYKWEYQTGTWVKSRDEVTIRLIGTAAEDVLEGVICASFHAG